MPHEDQRGVGGHEPPPPSPLVLGGAVAFDIAALIAILLDRCDLATILIIIATLLGGWALLKMMAGSKAGVGG